jgi:uncharacterized protein involved in outer membrane biogenesis
MRVSKPLRWILYILGGLVATLLLIIILLSVIRIPIDLSSQKGLVESTASLALGRTVKIDDKIVITTSVRPIFSLEGLRISNPKGFEKGDFLKMKTAEIQVRLLPLLLGKLQISKFSVKGLAVMLVENKTGAVNWSSQTPEKSKSEPPPPPKPSSEESRLELTSDSLVLAKLVLEDILVDYRSPSQAEPLQFKIDECTGDMLPGRPFILSMKGKLGGEPYVTTIEIGSLQELVEDNRSRMEVKTEIAKTQFDFAGSLDLARALRSLHLNAMVTGERLDSLNGLLDLDLPPLKSYKAAAQLAMRRDRIDLTDLILQVGKSKLTGKLTADRSGGKPDVVIDLNSPLIQLNDFDLGDWSPEKGDAGQPEGSQDRDKKAETAKADNDKSSTDQAVEELLSPKVLAKFNVRMNVKAEKVMSGADALGSGVLTATLKDGQFALDPVKLNIPGGSFTMAATLKPDPKAPEASLRMLMKNFDFGVLVRRANPRADMGGTINLDVDLKSSANSFDKLMAYGNGYFDFAGRLENLKAGIIDLWAVNVIAAVASGKENKPSEINCVLGRWTMKEGLLQPDVFLIDTTKIRICGKGQVDFKKETIDLKMAPTPKKPEFFSLATPVEVRGNFVDFGVGVQAGGLVGTTVRFIASPVTVPLRRLFSKDLPADGGDVCGMPIGPENRSAKAPAGCK